MNAVIPIQERDAIPVRALPWITRWEFDAQDVINALGGEKRYESFSGLTAYRLDGDAVEKVAIGEWPGVVQLALENVADDLPKDQWRREATGALPVGVFVWKDEFEAAYNQSLEGLTHIAADGDPDALRDLKIQTLHFNPAAPSNCVGLVGEGFAQSESAPVVQVDSTVVKHVSKGRQKGAIANIIDEIIRSNVGYSSALIWEALKALALDGRAPFTGAISGKDEPEVGLGSLAYTNTKNAISWFTRRKLTDYLGRK